MNPLMKSNHTTVVLTVQGLVSQIKDKEKHNKIS